MKTSLLMIIVLIAVGSIAALVMAEMYRGQIDWKERVGGLVDETRRIEVSPAHDPMTSFLESDEGKKYEPRVLQCLSLLYHCDVSSEYFEGCISAKKDGITVEELCSSTDIVIEN